MGVTNCNRLIFNLNQVFTISDKDMYNAVIAELRAACACYYLIDL